MFYGRSEHNFRIIIQYVRWQSKCVSVMGGRLLHMCALNGFSWLHNEFGGSWKVKATIISE